MAAAAGVGISTVSRVLNGGRVSTDARRRVQRVIDELGYVPTIAAQQLVHGRTGCVGLAVNSTQSQWFTQILHGVEVALARTRHSVLLGSLSLEGRYDPAVAMSWLAEHRVDGLVLVRYRRRDRALLDAAEEVHVPVALVAPDEVAPAAFTVRSDNLGAGRLVAEHLVELGHRQIAFFGGPRESVDARQRLDGLRSGLAEAGIELRDACVRFAPSYAFEAGAACLPDALAIEPRPTAVVLGNDTLALGFLRAAQRAGLAVPRDVSVVGFDGTEESAQCWPSLTTVVQPTARMAQTACEALIDRVMGRPRSGPASWELPVTLAVRESTGPGPGLALAPASQAAR